jgi:glutathione S-transferase
MHDTRRRRIHRAFFCSRRRWLATTDAHPLEKSCRLRHGGRTSPTDLPASLLLHSMSAPRLRLTYYPFGGLAAVPRLCLVQGNIEFEDARMTGEELEAAMEADKKRFPNATVPVLEIDGGRVVLSQSMPITFYCARLAGLFPTDPLQIADAEEVQAQVLDFFQALYATVGKEGDELKKAREEWAAGPGAAHLRRLDQIWERGSAEGPYLHGDRVGVSDLTAFALIGHVRAGHLDHIPDDLFDACPRLKAAAAAVAGLPAVKEFVTKHPAL